MTASDTQASTPDESSWHPPVSDHDYSAADTAVLSPTARPPKRDRFGAPIGFAVALLLVVIGVAAYFGIHALIKPQPFSLTGTLQLNSDNLKTSGLPMGYTCAGQGGYDDIGPGTPVTVADDSGKLVAKGAIESSYSASGACMLTFKVRGQSRNHCLLGRLGVHHDNPAPFGHSRATGPRTSTTSETYSRRPTT